MYSPPSDIKGAPKISERKIFLHEASATFQSVDSICTSFCIYQDETFVLIDLLPKGSFIFLDHLNDKSHIVAITTAEGHYVINIC